MSIIGHSGCSKSTLLSIWYQASCRSRPAACSLRTREVNEAGPDRAVVFQNHSLLPWLSVYANVKIAVDKVFSSIKSKQERHDWIDGQPRPRADEPMPRTSVRRKSPAA